MQHFPTILEKNVQHAEALKIPEGMGAYIAVLTLN